MEYLNYEISDDVAVLQVNRPQVLNALNRAVLKEMQHFLQSTALEKQIKVLILTGAGEKAFIAGADIKEIAARRAIYDYALKLLDAEFTDCAKQILDSVAKDTVDSLRKEARAGKKLSDHDRHWFAFALEGSNGAERIKNPKAKEAIYDKAWQFLPQYSPPTVALNRK